MKTNPRTLRRASSSAVATVMVVLLATACKGKLLGGQDAGGGAVGIEAKDNDAAVVTLAKAALACPTGSGSELFQYECPAYKKWQEGKELTSAAPTLVSMLEDPSPRVRLLATSGLSNSDAYREDKTLATRVVAAAESERDTTVAGSVGERVARIKVGKTGLFDRVAAIGKTHPVTAMRRAIASSLLFANSDSKQVFDYTVAMAKDTDPDVRGAAVSAFWVGGSFSRSDTCKVWASHLDDSKASIAGSAASSLGGYRGCGPQFDALINATQKGVTGVAREESGFARGLGSACESGEATAPQRAKALALAKTLTSDRASHVFVRTGGLNAVAKCDPTGGKGFIAGFTKDKEKWVAEEAVKLLAPKKK